MLIPFLQLLMEVKVFLGQLIDLNGLPDQYLQLDRFPRFMEKMENLPFIDSLNHGIKIGISSNEYSDGLGMFFADPCQEFGSGFTRHALIA